MSGTESELLLIFFSSVEERPEGTIHLPRLQMGKRFFGLDELVLYADMLLSQAASVSGSPGLLNDTYWLRRERRASLACIVQVLGRENDTWQGMLMSRKRDGRMLFRSVLELMELLQDILDAKRQELKTPVLELM